MQLTAELTIGNRIITTKEITVRQIRQFWNDFETEQAIGIEGLYNVLEKFIPICVQGVTIADLIDMTPSEIKQIYDKFCEVNATFFQVARLVEGENPIIVGLRQAIVPLLMIRFVDLFKPVTSASGTTDTASS
jgi:hypothetical protein